MRLIRGSVQPGEEKATSRVFEAAQGLLGGKHICGGLSHLCSFIVRLSLRGWAMHVGRCLQLVRLRSMRHPSAGIIRQRGAWQRD